MLVGAEDQSPLLYISRLFHMENNTFKHQVASLVYFSSTSLEAMATACEHSRKHVNYWANALPCISLGCLGAAVSMTWDSHNINFSLVSCSSSVFQPHYGSVF